MNYGESCQIAIRFSPKGIGLRNATLVLTANAASSPQSFTLSGTGFVPAAAPETRQADDSCVTFLANKTAQANAAGQWFNIELTIHRERDKLVSYSAGSLGPQPEGSFSGSANQLFSDRLTGNQPIGFPEAEISNGILHARLYLPVSVKGYYRGTRFDWSGVMPVLEYKGHSYCGQWFVRYAPTTHDAIVGPVESFSPLGYEGEGAGGGFVQIGVGVLARPEGSPYSPFKYYKVLDPGSWR